MTAQVPAFPIRTTDKREFTVRARLTAGDVVAALVGIPAEAQITSVEHDHPVTWNGVREVVITAEMVLAKEET